MGTRLTALERLARDRGQRIAALHVPGEKPGRAHIDLGDARQDFDHRTQGVQSMKIYAARVRSAYARV